MSRAESKSIRVRCGTWDQVEAFYSEKVQAQRGNILVVKMPFRPGIGEPMTVALGLPDGLVFAIEGTVVKIGAEDAGRVPVAVRLHGLGAEVRAQLKRLVAQGRGLAAPITPVGGTKAMGTRPPAPRAEKAAALIETVPPASDPTLRDVVEDERDVFDALAATRERVSALPAHEVLGVAADAKEERVRAGYLATALQVHPDRFRRYRSPALRLLASEVFVLVRRAYERIQNAEPGGAEAGWLHEMPEPGDVAVAAAPESSGVPTEAMQLTGSAPYSEMSIIQTPPPSTSYEDEVTFTTSVRMRALTAEELFDEEPTPTTPPPPIPGSPSAPADMGAGSSPTAAASVTASAPPSSPESPRPDPAELEAAARAALSEGRYREACEAFAVVLRQDPRNRTLRALYHVASGLDLRSRGEGVKARLQFETALAHDRECEAARRALLHEHVDGEGGGQGAQGPAKKGGIFKRLFDK